MTFEKLLLSLAEKQLKTHPELGNLANLIKEFQHAPWDYRVFGPVNLEDDEACVNIYLSVGKTHKVYDIVLKLDLETMILSSEEMDTPKVKTLKKGR